MTLDKFRKTIVETAVPPTELSGPLQALWWDAKGDWHRAHDCCQAAKSLDGDWVHAYLHRKEGDDGNAGYWYNRSGKKPHPGTLEEEWEAIATQLLEGGGN